MTAGIITAEADLRAEAKRCVPAGAIQWAAAYSLPPVILSFSIPHPARPPLNSGSYHLPNYTFADHV